MKGEVKSEEETKKQLLAKFEETGKKDAELSHILNAESFIKKLHSGAAYEEIIVSLIGSKLGSYPNRPDDAQKEAIKRAEKILNEIIKNPITHIELELTSKEAKEVKEQDSGLHKSLLVPYRTRRQIQPFIWPADIARSHLQIKIRRRLRCKKPYLQIGRSNQDSQH